MEEDSKFDSPHDSDASVQALEIAQLRSTIEELQQSKTGLMQELSGCKAQLQDKKHEVFRATSDNSKRTRELEKLKKDMEELRKTTDREVMDMRAKLERANKLQKKRQEANQASEPSDTFKKEIMNLKARLQNTIKLKEEREEEHESIIVRLRAEVDIMTLEQYNKENELFQVKQQVQELQSEIEAIRDTSCLSPTHSGTIEPLTPFMRYTKDLEEKNEWLSKGHERGCAEDAIFTAQRLEEAEALQRAAEAEIDGLRHIEVANKELVLQNDKLQEAQVKLVNERTQMEKANDVMRSEIVKMLHEHDERKEKIAELETEIQALKRPWKPEFSAVSCQAQMTPVDITKLHSIDLEVSQTTSQANISPVSATKRIPEPLNLSLSGSTCQVYTSPPPAIRHTSPLTVSIMEAASSSPCASIAPIDLRHDPEFVAALNDLGAHINSLTIPTLPNFQLPTLKSTTPRPSVAVTINIKPSDRKNWTLLTHVGQAISETSTLNIVAHDDKVLKDFVDSMERVSVEHEEQGRAVKQWEKVAQLHRKEVEELEKERDARPTCVDKGHRNLVEELKAKEVQYQLTQMMLAEMGKDGKRSEVY